MYFIVFLNITEMEKSVGEEYVVEWSSGVRVFLEHM